MKLRKAFPILLSILLSTVTYSTRAPGNELSQTSTATLVRGHSHNDYEQRQPLHDALDQRFYSVEADIWLRGGKILVSHLGWSFKGSLEDLYLKPMQALIDRQGSIHGDGRPFYLWLDIKDGSAQLRAALHALLEKYSMFTTFGGAQPAPGPITAILTGDEKSKTRFVDEHPVRKACRDSNYFSAQDPQGDDRWAWYAIEWSDYLHWKGHGPIPAKEAKLLRQLIASAHAKGRKLRFWDVPGNEAVWKAALDAGADQISADDLPRMRRFLEESPDLMFAQAR